MLETRFPPYLPVAVIGGVTALKLALMGVPSGSACPKTAGQEACFWSLAISRRLRRIGGARFSLPSERSSDKAGVARPHRQPNRPHRQAAHGPLYVGQAGVPSISANLRAVTPPMTATGRYGGNRVSNILRPRCSRLAPMEGTPSGLRLGSGCLRFE